MNHLGIAITFGLSLALGCTAASADYPDKPVRLIIAFPPGGSMDIVGRLTAKKLSEGLPQAVIVENRPGAGGTVGAEAAARSAPDGYTVLLGTTGTLATAPSLYPRIGYDPIKDFTPIGRLTNAVFLVVAETSIGVVSLQELVRLAKSRPGQLMYGSAGNGTPPHIAGEMFRIASGVELVHVPYKGIPPAVADLIAGRIQLLFEQLPSLHPHIRSGKVKPLAVAGPYRLSQLPDVPTTAEAGLPGYEVSAWAGLVAPAGTPREIVLRLNGQIQKALATGDLRDAFARHGLEPTGGSPEEFGALIREEAAKWSRAVRLSGAKLD